MLMSQIENLVGIWMLFKLEKWSNFLILVWTQFEGLALIRGNPKFRPHYLEISDVIISY